MSLTFPEDRRYSEADLWARLEDDYVRVGISDFARDQLGQIIYAFLPEVGTELRAGDPFGEIESTKTASDLVSPVSGTVHARNDALDEDPDILNEDPNEVGWLVVVDPSDPEELEALMSSDAYRQLRLSAE